MNFEQFQLAADYRLAICELTENVFATIIKNYPKVADDTKILICKLLHTSLIVHNPQVDGKTYEYAACKSTWNLHIRNMMYLAQNEIVRLRNNRLANSVICEHFVLFASKLCSVVSYINRRLFYFIMNDCLANHFFFFDFIRAGILG